MDTAKDTLDQVLTKNINQNQFNWEDPLILEDLLTEEEKIVRDSAKSYCQEKLMPRILEANRGEVFDRDIMNEFGNVAN